MSPFLSLSASAASIAAGEQHSAVIGSDGTVWTWGGNSHGQLGLGTLKAEPIPERVMTSSAFESVAAGRAHTLGISEDGRLFAWGRNLEGQLGLGDSQNRENPTQVGSETGWEAIAAGAFHAVGIRDGKLFAWGSNSAGQIGDGSLSMVREPVEIGNGETWLAVAAGEFHSMAIRLDGTLWGWGSNNENQLGIPSVSVSNSPRQIGSDSDWKSIASGSWHSLALKTDGSLWAWGRNQEGQLGIGARAADKESPTKVGNHSDWIAVAAGRAHSVGLRAGVAGQTLWTWGENVHGQLGDGSHSQRWVPIPIGTESDWIAIAAGSNHTVGLTSDFRVLSTGSNRDSQLGIGQAEVDQVNRFHAAIFRKPDLEVTAVDWDSFDPLGLFGEPFEVELQWRNGGSAPLLETVEFDIQFLLIGEDGVAEGIVLHEERFSKRVEINEDLDQTFSIYPTVAIPAGEYRLAVILDPEGVVDETIVENNVRWTGATRLFLSDLRVAEIDSAAVSVLPGEETVFDIIVENAGIADLADVSFDVKVALRPEAGGADYLLPEVWPSVEALGAGDSVRLQIPATIPVYLPPGNYYLVVELNGAGALQELNDANNSDLSGTAFLTVGGVSLAEAIGQPGLIFTQSPDRLWFGQSENGFTGFGAATVTGVPAGENAWFEFTVATPKTITFRWKSELEEEESGLAFSVTHGVTVYSEIITGETDWKRVTVDVAAGSILRWTFVQGEEEGGSVWISGLQVTDQNLPDLAVLDASYEAGNYVLQRDSLSLTATGANLGDPTDLPVGLHLTAYLAENSRGPRIRLGELSLYRELGAGSRFGYQAILPLADSIPAGDYHLLLEVSGGPGFQESDAENNLWISSLPDIRIERRPNLRIVEIVFAGDTPDVGDEIAFDVTIANDGLTEVRVGQPFEIRLHLTEEAGFGGSGDLLLTSYQETLGIAAGNSVTYQLRAPVPHEIALGTSYYAGAFVDANDDVPESDETDNIRFSLMPDLIFSQVSLEEALAIAGATAQITTGGLGVLPWFGQKTESFDGFAAAQSGRARDGQSSALEVEVELAEPGRISFYWKVSSERTDTGNGIKEDFLSFSVNGGERARISGEVDWSRAVVDLPAGLSILRWEYVKDDSGSAGADAAWVDAIRFGPAVSEVSLSEALDDDSNPFDPLWIDGGWTTDFDRPWFGQEDRLLTDGTDSSFDGEDAAQSAPIAPGESSWLERMIALDPTGPAVVTFRWKISADQTSALIFSISGKEQARINGSKEWAEVEFLVPAGPQLLRWEFVKNIASQTAEDAAFLDTVSIREVTKPDLVISSVVFTSDDYVVERDGLPLEVTVRNQGASLDGFLWNNSDLAVRLSRDRVWGNEDDVILGHFAEVRTFESTGRVVFSGTITLPLSVPEGEFYLAILADPFEKTDEWSRENNFYWSASRDIVIRRLPDLELASADFDTRLAYYPGSNLKLDFRVQNRGLGDVPGGIETTHLVELIARQIEDDDGEPIDPVLWEEAPVVAELASIIDEAFLPGVSPSWPEGSGLDYEAFLDLPSESQLMEFFGVSIGALSSELEKWEFSLAVTLNYGEAVEETREIKPNYLNTSFFIYGNDGSVTTFADWAARHGLSIPDRDSPEFRVQLAQYAFNQLDAGSFEERSPVGRERVNGEDYFRLTFNIVKGATDLIYEFQVSTEMDDWQTIEDVRPPYTARNGPQSLTGIGGLSSKALVVAVADNGYTAAVTMRDVYTTDSRGKGFFRVLVRYNP